MNPTPRTQNPEPCPIQSPRTDGSVGIDTQRGGGGTESHDTRARRRTGYSWILPNRKPKIPKPNP